MATAKLGIRKTMQLGNETPKTVLHWYSPWDVGRKQI